MGDCKHNVERKSQRLLIDGFISGRARTKQIAVINVADKLRRAGDKVIDMNRYGVSG